MFKILRKLTSRQIHSRQGGDAAVTVCGLWTVEISRLGKRKDCGCCHKPALPTGKERRTWWLRKERLERWTVDSTQPRVAVRSDQIKTRQIVLWWRADLKT